MIQADVVVLGGGPAGATAAATLAMRGRRVVLLERETFPRYHIGESLLPYGWWTLQRLGVLDRMDEVGFQAKHSVQFATQDGQLSRPFLFTEHFDHPAARTWQVDRATFDKLLLDRARELGVEVHEATQVTALIETDGAVVGARAVGPDGELEVRASVVIDATGRDGVARKLRRWNVAEPYLQRVALWTYLDGSPRGEGVHEGATTVASIPGDGWFWHIPMRGDRVSLGVVAKADVLFAEGADLQAAFDRAVAMNPWVAERAAAGRQVGPVHVTRDYSYRARHCADDGLVLCGDAFAFLDPVFSSGVLLALRSGEEAARAVDEALAAGDVSAAAFEEYGRWLCEGIERMRALVWSFYDPGFSMGQLVRKHPDLRGDVTDLLIGNLFRGYEELISALAGFGVVPEPVTHGGPRLQAPT